jgi:uncharacterized membrane protein
MNKKSLYFVAAGIGLVATLILLLFNESENVTTSVALFIVWTVVMLVLGIRQKSSTRH